MGRASRSSAVELPKFAFRHRSGATHAPENFWRDLPGGGPAFRERGQKGRCSSCSNPLTQAKGRVDTVPVAGVVIVISIALVLGEGATPRPAAEWVQLEEPSQTNPSGSVVVAARQRPERR